MIPYIFIAIGMLFIIWSVIGFIKLLFLPFARMSSVVYKRKDDFLKYETKEGRRFFKLNLKQLAWTYVAFLFLGSCLFFAGVYLGYASKGSGFWFYKQMFGAEENGDYWDKISDDGNYICSDGNEYKYYIVVSGNQYVFCGKECESFEDLCNKLSIVKRGNTVILVDDFAVASKYYDIEARLKQTGIVIKTDEE